MAGFFQTLSASLEGLLNENSDARQGCAGLCDNTAGSHGRFAVCQKIINEQNPVFRLNIIGKESQLITGALCEGSDPGLIYISI